MLIIASVLRAFCVEVLKAVAVPGADALVIAETLVDANLDGIDTHGIVRLPVYASCLMKRRINPAPEVALRQVAPSLGCVDGQDGLGLLVAGKALDFAMKLAAESGTGFVTVKHSSHFGAASYYCKKAADAGFASVVFTNTPSGIPPWGGKTAYFGTNPIAFGFPGRNNQHVLVDMSSSVTARGRIIMAAKAGQDIPPGWAIDADGKPTTNAAEALKGAVLPMGGPKGYALALAVEIFSGILSGAAFGKHVGKMYDDGSAPVNVGHAILALDIAPLMALGLFQDRLETMILEIKEVLLAEGHEGIFIPGERKRRAAARRAQGIPLPDNVLAELDTLAEVLNVSLLSKSEAGGR